MTVDDLGAFGVGPFGLGPFDRVNDAGVFNLLGSRAIRVARFSMPDVTATQQVWRDSTGVYWVTQPTKDTAGSGNETTLLARVDASGALQDHMTVTDGGHGLSFAIDYDDDSNPRVYWRWQYSTTQDIVRFPYAAGGTIAEDDASVETVMSGPAGFFFVNPQADRLAVRDAGDGQGHAKVHLYQWSTVLAGTVSELANIEVESSQPQNDHTFQGHAVDQTYLYELNGDADTGSSERSRITAYSWADGSVTSRRDITYLGTSSGTPPGNSNEPEGLAFADASGDPVLVMSISQGDRDSRVYLLFEFQPAGATLPPIPPPQHVPFAIEIFDKNLSRTGMLSNPSSVTVMVVKNGLSSAEIVLPRTHPLVDACLAQPGARVTFTYRGEQILSGMVAGYTGETVVGGELTFTVVGDFALLQAVLAWPDVLSTDPYSWAQYDTQTGPAETVLKHYIDANLITRLAMPVEVGTDRGRGDKITVNGRFKPISDYLFPRVTRAGLVLTTKQGSDTVVFDVRQPAHFPLVLTPESGLVSSAVVTSTPPTVTRAVAGGSGSGTARAFATYADTGAETTWGKLGIRETFVDASTLDSSTALAAPAIQAVEDGTLTTGLQLTLKESGAFQFPGSYRVGDWVTESLLPGGGAARTHQLSQVVLTWAADSDEGLSVTPVVGDVTTPIGRWARKLSTTLERLRDLGSR